MPNNYLLNIQIVLHLNRWIYFSVSIIDIGFRTYSKCAVNPSTTACKLTTKITRVFSYQNWFKKDNLRVKYEGIIE